MRSATASAHAPLPSLVDHRFVPWVAALVALAVLVLFGQTTLTMVDTWRRSETYSHGFFVVPISIWLIWRRRGELAGVSVQPFWPGLMLVAAAGFVWFIGTLAEARVVEHFGLVGVILAAAVAVLGLRVAQIITFPLCFLLFMVPFGEALVPHLIAWTADFAVLALKLSGVPVYQEGSEFAIPTGRWSVVEACSGIRYLIASVMAGTLFSYLTYTSALRRAAFVAAALVVPVIANWMRAYLIVMIGHLSGNRIAAGVDHLIYGWIFFGMVIALLFWIGSKFRDAPQKSKRQLTPGSFSAITRRGAILSCAAATFAVAGLWSGLGMALSAAGVDVQRSIPPIEADGGWEAAEVSERAWRPRFHGARAERLQVFRKNSDRVAVFIAYYAGQTQGREMVSSDNVLVTNTDRKWLVTARREAELDWHGSRLPVSVATLTSRAAERVDLAWWYWTDGRTTTSDALSKARLAWSRLTARSDDSAAVFLSTIPSDRGDGAEALRRFALEMGEQVDRALAGAHNRGER